MRRPGLSEFIANIGVERRDGAFCYHSTFGGVKDSEFCDRKQDRFNRAIELKRHKRTVREQIVTNSAQKKAGELNGAPALEVIN
jgi:hypothetical protein